MQAIPVSLHKIPVGLHSTPACPKSTLVAKRYIMLLAVSFIAELRRAKRASGAPWVRNFGNLSMQEILVMTSAYAHPPVQTLGEGEWSPKAARRPGVEGGE